MLNTLQSRNKTCHNNAEYILYLIIFVYCNVNDEYYVLH